MTPLLILLSSFFDPLPISPACERKCLNLSSPEVAMMIGFDVN